MTMLVLAYLLGLPVAVWLLAAACAVIDEPKPIVALLRLIIGICLILILLLVTDRGLLTPLLYAFATVVLLHTLGFWLLRKRGIGVPIFQRTPPPPPLLQDEDSTDLPGKG